MEIERIRFQIACLGMDMIYLSLARNKGFMSCNLPTLDHSYCCGQLRPCGGGLLHLMDVADHKGHTIEVHDIKEKGGLGRVVKNCRRFEGEYCDLSTGTLKCVFLGHMREEAVGRMNHLKLFL